MLYFVCSLHLLKFESTIMKKYLILIYFCIYIILPSCNNASSSNNEVKEEYDFMNPEEIYELPKELKEISGLEYLDDDHLFAIQDEEGKIYVYNLKQKKITRKYKFKKEGDFEGIAMHQDKLYALESSAELYKVDYVTDEDKLEDDKVDLNIKDCDAEGICMDNESGKLLVVCKKVKKNVKIYSCKPKDNDGELYISIPEKEIEEYILSDNFLKTSHFVGKLFGIIPEDLFKPSGIAIHPINKDIYIISFHNFLIIRIDREGKLKYVRPLLSEYFSQPEGITFTNLGDMLISNESKEGKPNILRFKYNLND